MAQRDDDCPVCRGTGFKRVYEPRTGRTHLRECEHAYLICGPITLTGLSAIAAAVALVMLLLIGVPFAIVQMVMM